MASDDPVWVAEHLIADSLLFLKVLPESTQALVDIGSGAGFPGIPLRIVRPDMAITLVESRQRRASFLRAVVREVELRGVAVIDQRLESLSPRLDGCFDAATLRCAGKPRLLLASAMALVRSGGMVVASGPPASGEARRPEMPRGPRRRERDSSPEFERVMVSGLEGRPRQFLVARKS